MFLVAVALNLAFVAIEVGAGLYANSLALLADAGHNFSNVIGLVLSWVALVLARRQPSERFTYGLRGSTTATSLDGVPAAVRGRPIRRDTPGVRIRSYRRRR